MRKGRPGPRRGQGGFTLVETLITMAILGVLGVAVFTSIAFYFRNITVARERLDRSRVVKTAIDCFMAKGSLPVSSEMPGYTVSITEDTDALNLPGSLKAYVLTAVKEGSSDAFSYRFYWK